MILLDVMRLPVNSLVDTPVRLATFKPGHKEQNLMFTTDMTERVIDLPYYNNTVKGNNWLVIYTH